MDTLLIKRYYDFLNQKYDKSNPKEVLKRILVIEKIEEELRKQFKSKKKFENKMNKVLQEFQYDGNDLKRARKKDDKTQDELARDLNVSKPFISSMENNKKSLTKDAIQYIEDSVKRKRSIKSCYAFTVKMPMGIVPKGSKWV